MTDLSRRSTAPELMDTDCADYADYRACLADLAKVNVLTLAHRPTLAFLERLRRDGRLPKDRPLRLVDVGAGYGDMLRSIAAWARRRRVPVKLIGVDLNPWAARAAIGATSTNAPIEWLTGDAFAHDLDPDIIISSLFTHHLTDEELPLFLAWSERTARLGWFVNDLRRHSFPRWGFGVLARLMRWHRFVGHDGVVSIARAFTPSDWRARLAEAGLPPGAVEVRGRFPFRLCLARVKA